MKTITLPIGDVHLHESGHVSTSCKLFDDDLAESFKDWEYIAAIQGVLMLIGYHAQAGLDVESAEYLIGVEKVVERTKLIYPESAERVKPAE